MSIIDKIDVQVPLETETRDATDIDLEDLTSEDEKNESAPPDYQISTYPADYPLEVLYQNWKADEIIIPDFQRRFVWKQTQASKLIESFLVGLPVPAVFFYRERNSQKDLVIDGQQRLKSIFYYFDGFFGPEQEGSRRVFRLTGLSEESIYNEKTFEDLRDEDKRKLKRAILRAFIVQQSDPLDDTSMYHIFERLNTGGTMLTNQEIRNCVYHGNLTKFLQKINTSSEWRKILGKNEPDRRGKDIELLVRFFALRDLSAYNKPMKDFLSRFVKKNKNAPQEMLKEYQNLLDGTCKAIVKSLGEKPFHIRAGLNAAVFDAVTTAFSKHLDSIPEDINDRYKHLIGDDEFDYCTRSSTTDVDIVKRRFSQAEQFLFD
ncbi:MAG: DUF262 domain-containing protein [Gemmatimonadetes bacterium]|nr:DUF262 domain-containing protein [Gemmatimonadota bacterium]